MVAMNDFRHFFKNLRLFYYIDGGIYYSYRGVRKRRPIWETLHCVFDILLQTDNLN